MARIKSAWEIALEKTEDIKIDEKKIREKNEIQEVRKIAGSFLSSDTPDEKELKEKLAHFKENILKEALSLTILNGLSLPQDEITDDRYDRLAILLSLIAENNKDLIKIYEEIVKYLKQYPLHKKQLIEQMKASFEPELRKKEEEMKEQYGTSVSLNLEDDKEFLEVLRQNLERLNSMYDEQISKLKEDLKGSLE